MGIDLGINPLLGAFLWGIFSAISLLIGALLGIYLPLSQKATSLMMAFGAGALLFALSIEIYGKAICDYERVGNNDKWPMVLLAVGSVMGSLLFSVTNYVIETRGGIFRATEWDNDWVANLLCCKRYKHARHMEPLPDEPDVVITEDNGEQTHLLPTRVDARTSTTNPYAGRASVRLSMRQSVAMRQSLMSAVSPGGLAINDPQVGIAIWAGMLVDCIPESLVIGLLATAEGGVSFTFVMGVFISNLPEALSSSAIMRSAQFPKARIILMWAFIVAMTGIGALIGAVLFQGDQSRSQIMAAKAIEGLAAGAMLVIIAEANLPEAFRHCGSSVGFFTLMGFLAAYFIRLLEFS